MIKYKIDILPALKEKGYSTFRLRKERLLSESTIQQLRKGEYISLSGIDSICKMLQCQPADLIEYTE